MQGFEALGLNGVRDFEMLLTCCSNISDTIAAYSRNRVVDSVLKGSVSFSRTWQQDIVHLKDHIGKDCTHYCIPSDTTINWSVEVLKTIEYLLPTAPNAENK